jgi:hypothetical protein
MKISIQWVDQALFVDQPLFLLLGDEHLISWEHQLHVTMDDHGTCLRQSHQEDSFIIDN